MMYDYEPLNEEDAMRERFQLLPEGVYSAHVYKSTGKLSSSQNAMAELHIEVYDNEGKIHTVKDYIVFTRNMIWKMKHFCDSAGLTKEYEEKRFCAEIAEGKNVHVRIKVQNGNEIPMDKLQGKPVGTKYPDKNVIDDYVCIEMTEGIKKFKDDFKDDNLPF